MILMEDIKPGGYVVDEVRKRVLLATVLEKYRKNPEEASKYLVCDVVHYKNYAEEVK